jgi:hypothetical protein
MTIGRKRERITERGAKNARRGDQEVLVFPLFLFLALSQREKRQQERPPGPQKAGGKQMDGPGTLLLV